MRKPHLDLFAFPTRLFESFGLGEGAGDIAGILMQIAGICRAGVLGQHRSFLEHRYRSRI